MYCANFLGKPSLEKNGHCLKSGTGGGGAKKRTKEAYNLKTEHNEIFLNFCLKNVPNSSEAHLFLFLSFFLSLSHNVSMKGHKTHLLLFLRNIYIYKKIRKKFKINKTRPR